MALVSSSKTDSSNTSTLKKNIPGTNIPISGSKNTIPGTSIPTTKPTYDVRTGTYTSASGNKQSRPASNVPAGTVIVNTTPVRRGGGNSRSGSSGGSYDPNTATYTSPTGETQSRPQENVPTGTVVKPLTVAPNVRMNDLSSQDTILALQRQSLNQNIATYEDRYSGELSTSEYFRAQEEAKQLQAKIDLYNARSKEFSKPQFKPILNQPEQKDIDTRRSLNSQIKDDRSLPEKALGLNEGLEKLANPSQVTEALKETLIDTPKIIGESAKKKALLEAGNDNFKANLLLPQYLGKEIGTTVSGGIILAVSNPSGAIGGIVGSALTKPVKFIIQNEAYGLAFKGGGAILGDAGKTLEIGKPVITDSKSIAIIEKNYTDVVSKYRIKSGLKTFEIVQDVRIQPVSLEKIFGANKTLKIRGAPTRAQLPNQTSENLLRIQAGEQVLLLPEKAGEAIIKTETGLELSNAKLAKFYEQTQKTGSKSFSTMKPSLGEPFAFTETGVIRTRQIGLRERITDYFDKGKIDFVSEIKKAQALSFKKGKVSEIDGFGYGIQTQREIISKKSSKGDSSPTGGYAQAQLDLRRIEGNKTKLLEAVAGSSAPKVKVNLPSTMLGNARKTFDFGKPKSIPSSFSLTGRKGKIVVGEYVQGGTLRSTPREFITQDISVNIGNKEFIASRAKVEGFPESKTLFIKRGKSILEGEEIGNARTTKDYAKLSTKDKLTELQERKQLYLPKDEFRSPTVSDDVLQNIQSRISPTRKEVGSISGSVSGSQSAGAGRALRQVQEQIIRPRGDISTGSGFANLSSSGAGTILLTKQELLSKQKPRVEEKTDQVFKSKSPEFSSFAKQGIFSGFDSARGSAFATTGSFKQEVSRLQIHNGATKQDQSLSQNTGRAQLIIQTPAQKILPKQEISTKQSQNQLQKQFQKQLQKQLTKQTSRPVLNFKPPELPPLKRFNDPKGGLTNNKKVFGLTRTFDVFSRKKGKKIRIGSGLGIGRATRVGFNFTENRAARSFTLVQRGFTNQSDVSLPNLFQYRAPKFGGAVHREGFTFVEKSKFAINTPGEKKEISKRGLKKVFSF